MKRVPWILPIAAMIALISFAPWRIACAAQYTDAVHGYSFTYPDDWKAQPYEDAVGVVIRNFPRGKYLHGGSPPMGGANIGVGSYPPYPRWWPPDTDEYQWLENFGQGSNVLVHPSRSTPGPARLVFTSDSIAGTTETYEEIVIRTGGRLFRIGLTYQTADPNGPVYEQVLSGIVNSLVLATQATSTPPFPTAAPPTRAALNERNGPIHRP